MGLFKFAKKTPISEPMDVDWFFTDTAKKAFKNTLINKDEMYEICSKYNWPSKIAAYLAPKGDSYREEFPATFFADYLRALKTIDWPMLAVNAADLAIDGEIDAISYPNCLNPEYNPLINFAIKIKPIISHKNGKNLEYNAAMKSMIAYLHDIYTDDCIDESDEKWIYEENLWFDSKGKERDSSNIFADISAKVKRKDLLTKY